MEGMASAMDLSGTTIEEPNIPQSLGEGLRTTWKTVGSFISAAISETEEETDNANDASKSVA